MDDKLVMIHDGYLWFILGGHNQEFAPINDMDVSQGLVVQPIQCFVFFLSAWEQPFQLQCTGENIKSQKAKHHTCCRNAWRWLYNYYLVGSSW